MAVIKGYVKASKNLRISKSAEAQIINKIRNTLARVKVKGITFNCNNIYDFAETSYGGRFIVGIHSSPATFNEIKSAYTTMREAVFKVVDNVGENKYSQIIDGVLGHSNVVTYDNVGCDIAIYDANGEFCEEPSQSVGCDSYFWVQFDFLIN